MILSKVVVRIYTVLLEVGLWLLLVGGLIAGYEEQGVVGAIIGLIGAALFGTIFFGAFLVVNDIRARVEAIEARQKTES